MDDYKYRLKQYGYTKGTEYFVIGNQPIVFNIENKGDSFNFIPQDRQNDLCIGFVNQKSLLAGLTRLMAFATTECIKRTKESKRGNKNVNKKYILNGKNAANVVAYINFTHDMVFPDNDEEYRPLRDYICPNNRRPLNSVARYTTLLPKDLIKIEYSDQLNVFGVKESKMTTIDFFSDYVKVLTGNTEKANGDDFASRQIAKEHESLMKKLNTLKVKDQIDVPTKIEFYGVCNKFGGEKQQEYQGIVAILYIEHKVSVEDYLKFRRLCDEKINECLKPLNLDVDFIKNLTQEYLDSHYDTYAKIDKLAQACGEFGDPRGFGYEDGNVLSISLDYIYADESEYNEESGLAKWLGVKQYYPELYNGLRLILNQYLKFKTDYDKGIQDEYDKIMADYANQHKDYLLNSAEGTIYDNFDLIIKYINKVIANIEPIKVNSVEEFNMVIDSIYGYILEDINDLCTQIYLQQIKDYKLSHLKSNKMEIVYRDAFKGQGSIDRALEICPFNYSDLQSEIQEILNTIGMQSIKDFLRDVRISLDTIYKVYLNNKEIPPLKYHNRTVDGKSEKTIEIDDINSALHGKFIFAYEQRNDVDILHGIDGKLKSLNRLNANREIEITEDDIEEVLQAFFASPFAPKIVVKHKWQNDAYSRPTLIEPSGKHKYRDRNWVFDSDTQSAMDIVNKNNITPTENINKYIAFRTILEFTEPDKIVAKLKETRCYKEAINKIYNGKIVK